MPPYRFSWDAFDDRTVAALADTSGHDARLHIQTARAWLSARLKRPTPEFVRTTKDVLVRSWLPTYVGTKPIVDRLIDAGIGPMRQPRSPAGYVNYVRDCRNSKSLRQYVLEAMLTFGDCDHALGEEVTLEFTPRFAVLIPNTQRLDPRRPHGYQREAWDKLSAELARSRSTGIFQGLVVMPTGSGKTFTAVHWLLQHVVSGGGRVLWLAHRHELLSQAGAEFHKLAALAHPRERLRVRIVSGAHCTMTQVDPADDVVIASVASLARRPAIAQMLLQDEGHMVVIDEAHHAPAKSYRDLIEMLQARKTWRVLGLTATPTRAVEQQRPILAQLFGGRILYQVGLHELIERRILARPIPVIVSTGAHVEADVTDEDRAHYERFGEISEEWLDRIASYVERNALIVEHDLAERRKYGPTLIFAINVRHAALLTEDLRERGVRADYVASYRPDGSDGAPMDVIRQFRDGQLDVLVNVQMVTEGVEVPSIQSVFLTRPTTSEILMRQMIGRALRGPAVGGSEHAYLVSFEDHWDTFRDWDSSFDLVPDIEAVADREASEAGAVADVDRFQEHLPRGTLSVPPRWRFGRRPRAQGGCVRGGPRWLARPRAR
jgi:superfamily II DNA or RNA helicase